MHAGLSFAMTNAVAVLGGVVVPPPSDTTPPVINSSAFDGDDTITMTVTEAGTAYYLVDDNATRSAAQVKAGGGLQSGSFAVSAPSDTDDVDFSAVAAGAHYLHIMLEDPAGNPSAVESDEYTFPGPASSPTAPAQVTGLTATPGDGSVALAWTAPNSGGSAITDYLIEVNIAGAGWNAIADGVSTDVSFDHTGLTNGTEYVYRVSAVNAIDTGAASVAAGATPAVASPSPSITVGAPASYTADAVIAHEAHAEDDYLGIAIVTRGGDGLAEMILPAGWAVLGPSESGSGNTDAHLTVITKRAGSGAEPDVTVTQNGFQRIVCAPFTVSGVPAAGTPVSLAGSDNGTSTAMSAPGGTPPTANALILCLFGDIVDLDGPHVSGGFVNADLQGITKAADYGTSGNAGRGLSIAHGVRAPATAFGPTTGVNDAAGDWASMTLIFEAG